MAEPSRRVPSLKVTREGAAEATRVIPEEQAVALVYDGSSRAVMMATPRDLEDFGVGFSLTEGLINSPDQITALEIVEQEQGVEVRMWLAPDIARTLVERRRAIAGPTGCGLCGVESLEAALPPPRRVGNTAHATPDEVQSALAAMAPAQVLGGETRAVHAAALWHRDKGGLVLLREDVGRHNALDKLIGAVRREGLDPQGGMVVLTSRVSVEMVQKAAVLGVEILVAVSAPTALALRTAEAAGITLLAIARSDAFEVFTHPSRILTATQQDNRSRTEVSAYAVP